MTNEERFKLIFDASPSILAHVDAALEGELETEFSSLRLYRMNEAAAATGLSRTTIWRAIRDGRLRAVEIRRRSCRIAESELRRFMEGVPK